MVALENELTGKQINYINNAYQTGRVLNFKPTLKQINGGFLGTLATIGIPMATEWAWKRFGKGLSVPKSAKGLRVSPKPVLMPFDPPPFVGTWKNPVGMTQKKGQGLLLEKKNSPFNSIPVLGAIFWSLNSRIFH